MCNAKNHPPNCNCGFGGHGGIKFRYTAQGDLFTAHPKGIPTLRISNNSYDIPNSRCPVCREPVFYYQNEFGSKVFFDELGPPWPKHWCTSSGIFLPKKIVGSTPKKSTSINNGWLPVALLEAGKISNNVYEFICKSVEDKQIILFVAQKEVELRANLQAFSEESLCYIKPIDEDTYKISLVSDDLKILNSTAYINPDQVK